MAISQEKFVAITSKRVVTSQVISGFGALLVCDGSANTASGATVVAKTFQSYQEFEEDTVTSALMSTASKKAVENFFAIGNGNAPLTVAIAAGASGTAASAIAAVTTNWKIAFSADFQSTTASGDDPSPLDAFVTAVNAAGGVAVACVNSVTASAAVAAVDYASDDVIKMAAYAAADCALIPAILATTNYSNYIKKYFMASAGSITAFCTNDTDYETLIAAKFNFVGSIKTFGSSVKYLLGATTSKGTDLVSYFGQLWIEAQCKDNILNLMANEILTSANAIADVKNCVVDAATAGVTNGLIVVGKQFDADDSARIIGLTGSEDGVNTVVTNGFWIDAAIVSNQVSYVLVYADATGIKKVDGTHYIV